jgi:hypothetical protein
MRNIIAVYRYPEFVGVIRWGTHKSLDFPVSYFPICSTTKRFFLGWVKEVRTTKSLVYGAQGGILKKT